jgi:hypothetical protein
VQSTRVPPKEISTDPGVEPVNPSSMVTGRNSRLDRSDIDDGPGDGE